MKLIQKYFNDLSRDQLIQFEKLESLYKYWNSKINVISRKDIGSLYLKHVLHSLAIAKFIQFSRGTHIIDSLTSLKINFNSSILCAKQIFFDINIVYLKINILNLYNYIF